MSAPTRVAMSSDQAQDRLPDPVRSNIYSALMQSHGIPNIEDTLNHQMQATGFKAVLVAYINHLLRNEGVTSFPDIMDKVETKILHDTQQARSKDAANGVNGVNGHANDSDEYNLALPASVTKEGTKAVVKELEKVIDITDSDDK